MIQRIRVISGWFVIAALLLRGLIPVGYMPDFGVTGKAAHTITICTGTGPAQITVTESGGKTKTPETPSTHRHEAPCPFSVNAVFGLDGLQEPLQALTLCFLIAFLTLTALVLTPQRRFGNASSRSPPLFS